MVQMNLRRGSKSSLEESSEIILYEIILYTKGTLMHDLVSKIFLTLENLSVFNDFFVCKLGFRFCKYCGNILQDENDFTT